MHAPTSKNERTALLPEPLRVRSRTETSPEYEDQKMSVVDFLRDEAEYERHHQLQRATESPQEPGSSRSKKPSLFNLARMASSTFVKDSQESPKQTTEDLPMVPIGSGVTSPSASSSKPTVRSGSLGSGSGALSHIFPPIPIPVMQASESNDSGSKASAYGEGSTPTKADEPAPPLPPKSSKRKPLLTVDTAKAADLAKGSVFNSPVVSRGGNTLSASVGTDLEDPSSKAIASFPKNVLSPTTGKPNIERLTGDHPEVKVFQRDYLQDAFGVHSTNELLPPNEKRPEKKSRSERRAEKRLAKAAAKAQAHGGSERRLTDELKDTLNQASDQLEKAFPHEAQEDIADAYFKASPLEEDYPMKDLFPHDTIVSASSGLPVRTNTRANTDVSTPQHASGGTNIAGMAVGRGGSVPVRGKSQVTTAANTPQRASGDTNFTPITDSGSPLHGYGSVSRAGESRTTTVATTPQRASADTNIAGMVPTGSPSPRGHGSVSVRRKEVGPGTTKLSSYNDAAGPSSVAVEPSTSQTVGWETFIDAHSTPFRSNWREQKQESSAPYPRLRLEDESAGKATDKQLEKDDFVAHKVCSNFYCRGRSSLIPAIGQRAAQEDRYPDRPVLRE